MTPRDIVEQLLALPDLEAQKRYLEEHASLLDDAAAQSLKLQSDSLARSDVEHSLEVASLLLHMADLTNNPVHRALGLLARANALWCGRADYHQAIDAYDQAAQIYRDQDRPLDEARSQVGKVAALLHLGRYDEALQAGQSASRVIEEHGEWQPLGRLTVNLAAVHGMAGDDVKSLEMFDRAAAIYGQQGKEASPMWMRVQQNRAIALRNLGRFDESIEASRAALEGLAALGHKAEAARAQQNLARTYLMLGRYNEALVLLDQARDVFLADGRQRDAMLVELFTTDCLLKLRRFSDVLEKCRVVRELFTELGVRHAVAQAIVNEGVAYAELGRCEQALRSLGEARCHFGHEGNAVWVALTELEQAAVLGRQGRFDASLDTAERCAVAFGDGELPVLQAQAWLVGARAARALDQNDWASQLASEALQVGEALSVPNLTYQAHRLLGSLEAALGRPEQALLAYDRAIAQVERLRGHLMIEFRACFAEDKEQLYQDAVALCLDIDQPTRGLEYAERAKSRALLDLVAYRLDLGVQAREGRDEPIVEELVSLRAERDRLCRRWEADAESSERGWGASGSGRTQEQQDVLRLEKRITDLWHRLLVHDADYAREAATWAVRTEPVQPYLEAATALVEYFVVHDSLVAFLVTAGSVEARRFDCDLAKVQQLLQLLWLNLRAVPKSDADRVSSLADNARGLLGRLNELVWAPLSDLLDSYERLVIVPHGPLHYLPFHALHNGISYVVQRHQVSYLPGASFLRYCSEARPTATGAVSFGHSCGGRLPHAVQEARSIAQLGQGVAYLEEEATRDQLCRAAPDAQVLHIATHGDFRPDNPLFSGLELADGWLATLDIFDLRLDASLVTLSGCQTGRSVVGGGDELLGLMRAFLSAGAASLVLSFWAAEDRSTALLMESFYRRMAKGTSKAEALRGAQLELLDKKPGRRRLSYEHPYFWAPFFLVGNAGKL